jgi:hypothetical protein
MHIGFAMLIFLWFVIAVFIVAAIYQVVRSAGR